MKIVHVLESMGAGVLSSVSLCCNTLAHSGHKVYLVYSPNRPETPKNWNEMFSKEIITVQLDMRREVSPIYDLKSAIKLSSIIARIKPDIVHLHSSKAGAIGRIAKLFGRHKYLSVYSPRGLSYLNPANSHLKNSIFFTLEKVLAFVFPNTALLACSESEKLEIDKLNRKQHYVIENAIDLSSIQSRAVPPQPSKHELILIATAGRISSQKNPKYYASIARRLDRNKYKLLWIGDGDTQDKTDLMASDIDVTGWLSRSDTITRLSECSIYLQTSTYEGMPISVIEAQSMGIPCIVTDVIGNRDVIVDGVTGFTAHTVDEFVDRIHELSSYSVWQEFSDKAALLSERRFSTNRLLHDLENFYSKH